MTSKVVIAGGSGALGRRLVTSGAEKCELVVLTRRPDPEANVRQVFWDDETVADWAGELDEPQASAAACIGSDPAPVNISAELISGGNTTKLLALPLSTQC